MLLRWIEKTRKKPKAVRNQYAFMGALSLTAMVVVVWSLSLPAHFAAVDIDDEAKETKGAFSQFFSEAKNNLASVMAGIRSSEEPVDTAPPIATTSRSNVSMPDLTPDNVADLKAADDNFTFKKPRPVLIATTSSDLPAAATAQVGQASSTKQD